MSDILDQLVRVRPFQGEAEFKSLVDAARKENHGVINPTDVLWKGNERVGFLSIGALPTIWAWLSKKEFSARDTVEMFNVVETVCRRQSVGLYMPMPKDSPVHPYMERLGYTNGGNYDFFFKDLTK